MEHHKPAASFFRTWTRRLASPAVVFFTLPWLMILLAAGTIAQKEMGLYAAHNMFFSSWILWLGPFPLPGAYPTLGLLTLGLSLKFLFYSPWRLERAGTILTHLGLLILLIGGLLTALTQKEGFLILPEGASSTAVSDYHARVLMIEKDGKNIAAIPFEHLKRGSLTVKELPFDVTIQSVCTNCRPAPVKDSSDRHGLAEKITLREAPPEKNNEENMAGAALALTGLPDAQDGLYITLEDVPHTPSVTYRNETYSFRMMRQQRQLPFEIALVDFTREMHPGTNVARAYSSDILVRDQGLEWPYHIRMNEPLRYKGYTLYQASFSERSDGTVSILSVVENKGRAFPYVASAVIFLGLAVHVALRLNSKRKTA